MAVASVGVFPHLCSDMVDSHEGSAGSGQILDVENGSPEKLSEFKSNEALITELRLIKEDGKTFSELKSFGESGEKSSIQEIHSKSNS